MAKVCITILPSLLRVLQSSMSEGLIQDLSVSCLPDEQLNKSAELTPLTFTTDVLDCPCTQQDQTRACLRSVLQATSFMPSLRGSLLKGGYNGSLNVPLSVSGPAPPHPSFAPQAPPPPLT